MTRAGIVRASVFILVSAVPAIGQTSAPDDCESRMQQLEASNAEGEDRLREKYDVIEVCDRQYARDKTIQRLVRECAKYVEQPVVKQQFMAECQLAAFNYANALRTLKSQYKK